VDLLSLCSGGGGLELGVHLAGRLLGFRPRVLCYVERELFAASILAQRMEEGHLAPAPIWSDLKTFADGPARDLGNVDLVIGGYPCQPFSAAGKREGVEDERHLWPHILGILATVRPVWCFFENVEGHLSLGFREVVASLHDLGYVVEAGLFSAEEVGAPHRRKRLFILAHDAGKSAGISQGGNGRKSSGGGESELEHAPQHGAQEPQPADQVAGRGSPPGSPDGAIEELEYTTDERHPEREAERRGQSDWPHGDSLRSEI
jgi:DNA (cytosine-5)-methyltransferase 1